MLSYSVAGSKGTLEEDTAKTRSEQVAPRFRGRV